jgi:hypothetical protein
MKFDPMDPDDQWAVKLQQQSADAGITAQMRSDENFMKARQGDAIATILTQLLQREDELAQAGLVISAVAS